MTKQERANLERVIEKYIRKRKMFSDFTDSAEIRGDEQGREYWCGKWAVADDIVIDLQELIRKN